MVACYCSGQKPLITKARKSVAGFKIRQGYPIGCKVTLRGERMWEFFERLITIAVPRIRDFRGLSAKSFDGRGNYSMGVRDQTKRSVRRLLTAPVRRPVPVFCSAVALFALPTKRYVKNW